MELLATRPRHAWPPRIVAVACSALAIILAAVGLRLLFAGDWLESHDPRYGALFLLALAVAVGITAIVLAAVGAARRPREIASWAALALVVVPVPLVFMGAQLLGI